MDRLPNTISTAIAHQRLRGFTFIELLIYLGIVGLLASALIHLSVSFSKARNKTYVVQEVQANVRGALDIVSRRIREATGVNVSASTFGVDPGVLSLVMADAALNPTIINLTADNGILQIQEGAASPVPLVSDEVQITNLIFTTLTDGTRENIGVQLTIAYNTPSGEVEFFYAQSVQTAVSVRQ